MGDTYLLVVYKLIKINIDFHIINCFFNKVNIESEDRNTTQTNENGEMSNANRDPAAQGTQNDSSTEKSPTERNIDPQNSVILMELLGNAKQENLIKDGETIRTLLKNSPFGRK